MEQALRHYRVELIEGEGTRTLTFACKGVEEIKVEARPELHISVWKVIDVEDTVVFAGQGVQCIYEITDQT